jgi:hypothetical protein
MHLGSADSRFLAADLRGRTVCKTVLARAANQRRRTTRSPCGIPPQHVEGVNPSKGNGNSADPETAGPRAPGKEFPWSRFWAAYGFPSRTSSACSGVIVALPACEGIVEADDPLAKPGGVDWHRERMKDLDVDHCYLSDGARSLDLRRISMREVTDILPVPRWVYRRECRTPGRHGCVSRDGHGLMLERPLRPSRLPQPWHTTCSDHAAPSYLSSSRAKESMNSWADCAESDPLGAM